MKSILLLIVIELCFACSDKEAEKENKQLSTKIQNALSSKNFTVLDLSKISNKNWDSVCFIGPYATNDYIEKEFGIKWDIEKYTEITGSDGISLLLFIKNNQVIEFVQHPRNKGDFNYITPKCLPNNDAKLIMAGVRNWDYLVKKPNLN